MSLSEGVPFPSITRQISVEFLVLKVKDGFEILHFYFSPFSTQISHQQTFEFSKQNPQDFQSRLCDFVKDRSFYPSNFRLIFKYPFHTCLLKISVSQGYWHPVNNEFLKYELNHYSYQDCFSNLPLVKM